MDILSLLLWDGEEARSSGMWLCFEILGTQPKVLLWMVRFASTARCNLTVGLLYTFVERRRFGKFTGLSFCSVPSYELFVIELPRPSFYFGMLHGSHA